MTTVLLAEGDLAIAEPLSRTLEREGYWVVIAADGVAALDQTRQGPVDLLVLDLGLPGMDGLEVCRRLRVTLRAPTRSTSSSGSTRALMTT